MTVQLDKIMSLRISDELEQHLYRVAYDRGVSASALARSFIIAGLHKDVPQLDIGAELKRLSDTIDDLRADLEHRPAA